MRAQRLRPLAAASLSALPSCARCGSRHLDDQQWARAAEQRWGLVGVGAVNNSRTIGYLLFAPAMNLPAGHPAQGWAPKADAAAIVSVYIEPDFRHFGVGKQLVQSAAARLVDQAPVLEAAGSLGLPSCSAAPETWLSHHGFQRDCPGNGASIQRQSPEARVHMRMELNRTVKWRPSLKKLLAPAWPAPETT